MGKRATAANDEAKGIVQGTFVATGQSGNAVTSLGSNMAPCFFGFFNVSIYGVFVGTVQLERSFDGGTNWVAVSKDTSGNAASYTGPASIVCNEPELGVIYRLNCTAYTSGTISYRISQ